MEAFLSRGKKDLFASHDLEDIIYILDNRPEIREEILVAPATVKNFLLEQPKMLTSNVHFEEA